jgi:hypothetical protein
LLKRRARVASKGGRQRDAGRSGEPARKASKIIAHAEPKGIKGKGSEAMEAEEREARGRQSQGTNLDFFEGASITHCYIRAMHAICMFHDPIPRRSRKT